MSDGNPSALEFALGHAKMNVERSLLGEFGERLGEEDEALAVEAETGEERLVEHEDHREVVALCRGDRRSRATRRSATPCRAATS